MLDLIYFKDGSKKVYNTTYFFLTIHMKNQMGDPVVWN